jgi:PAS domain S-box-containing protein
MKGKRTTKKMKGARERKPKERIRRSTHKKGKDRKEQVTRRGRSKSDALRKVDASLCERLAYLLTETSVVVYAAKASGNYGGTFVSENVRKITGYSAKSFINQSDFWVKHVHAEDREWVLKEVKCVFDTDYHEYEYRFRHKKGHYIWMHDEMRLIRDSKGTPKEIIGYWTDITKRKELEAEAAMRAERVSEFMESANEGFVLLDSKFNFISVNRFLLDRFGVKREDALRMNYLDISDSAYECGRYQDYIEILETGRPRFYDDIVLPPEYGDRHVSAHVFKVGDCLGLIIREVTDEVKRHNALRESEVRLRSLLESTNVGVAIHDMDGTITMVNDRACELLDMSKSEIIGAKSVDVCNNLRDENGKEIKEEDDPVSRTARTRQPVSNIKVFLTTEESEGGRWLLVNTDPIFDPETGELDEILCSFIDITEQKYVEDELAESEERYRQIFENCPIGIGISDDEGKVVTANNAMQRITGYSLAEFKKVNLADTFVDPGERDKMVKILGEKGHISDYHVRLVRRDGTPYDAVLNISRIEIGGKVYNHTMCHVVTP